MENSINLQELISLDRQRQIAFSYLISKRVLPNCIKFSEKYSFGNIHIFTDSIALIEKAIFRDVDIQVIKNQVAILFSHIPGTNKFPNYDGTIAMYCGGAIHESLRFIADGNSRDLIKDICIQLTDAIDCYVQEVRDLDYEDEDFEERIAGDPVFVAEVMLQNEIIKYLKNVKSFEQSDLEHLNFIVQNKNLDLLID